MDAYWRLCCGPLSVDNVGAVDPAWPAIVRSGQTPLYGRLINTCTRGQRSLTPCEPLEVSVTITGLNVVSGFNGEVAMGARSGRCSSRRHARMKYPLLLTFCELSPKKPSVIGRVRDGSFHEVVEMTDSSLTQSVVRLRSVIAVFRSAGAADFSAIFSITLLSHPLEVSCISWREFFSENTRVVER